MRTEIRYICIAMLNAGNRHYGLGEFEYQLGRRIADRADNLAAAGLRVCMLVSRGQEGIFGESVSYIAVGKDEERRLRKSRAGVLTPDGRPFALLHITNQGLMLRGIAAERRLMTVHDMNFLHNGLPWWRVWLKKRKSRRLLSQATDVAYISQFTRQDTELHFAPPARGRLIYNGVTDLRQGESRRPEGIGDYDYLYHVSRMAKKKNVDLLIEMVRLDDSLHLVLSGSGRRKVLRRLYRLAQGCERIHFTGIVSEAEKHWLLEHCRGFLFASRSEGFGLPVAEAMLFGKPVFVSRATSLPEVAGESGYYFSSYEPQDMLADVRSGLRDYDTTPSRREEIIKTAERFSWDKAAQSYIDYYLEIAGC